MSSSKPTIYISKRCEYCIELLKILRSRPDIKGNFTILSIDDNPFPKYVKAVPCMVSGDELYSSKEIFAMLDESNDGGNQTGGSECSVNGGSGEMECSVDGYCKSDTCLTFSSIDGMNDSSLESYYSTFDKIQDNATPQTTDDYRDKKKNSFDSDYERLMNERSQMEGGNPAQQQRVDFSRR